VSVKGAATTSASKLLAGNFAGADSEIVARCRRAGLVIFGKTNSSEFGLAAATEPALYGVTRNPWDLTRSPGGSSGGSAAALAAGLCALELGSDIGGSIRNPAHFCGVYGHKPSYGLVPTRGHVPGPPGARGEADLAVIGPLARSAGDLALALDVIAGPDAAHARAWRLALPPPRRDGLRGLRVAAWLDDPACPVSADVGDALQAALDALAAAGAVVDAGARPVDPRESRAVYLQLLYGVLASGLPAPLLAAFDAQAPGLDPADDAFTACLVRGAAQRHREWLVAHERRLALGARWEAFFRDADVLVAPILPTVAFPHDHSELATRTVDVDGRAFPYLEQLFWPGLATGEGLPATAVPIGRGRRSGLPVGMQVIGPFLEDRTPLAVAAALAETLGGFVPPPGYA